MDGRYVLVIERDWRMRKLIRVNLEALGLRVREAVSGQHGLGLLGEGMPDLILLDLDLPDVDAGQLFELLRSRIAERQLAIIVLSAEPPGGRWQAVRYLQKPFAVPALLRQVRQALGNVR